MKIKVNVNDLEVIETDIFNAGEYQIHKCHFLFSNEYRNLINKAVFTVGTNSYEVVINNGECDIPYEVLSKRAIVVLGVYGYDIVDDNLIIRYSPKTTDFFVDRGSYIENTLPSKEITPSQFEQYEKALNEGLIEIRDQMDSIQNQVKNGELNGATFIPQIDDDGNLSFTNDKDLENPPVVNIRGPMGLQGEQGLPGSDGEKGDPGQDGMTPVKGIDYFTDEEQQDIVNKVRSDVNDELEVLMLRNRISGSLLQFDDALNYKIFETKIYGEAHRTGQACFNQEQQIKTVNEVTLNINNQQMPIDLRNYELVKHNIADELIIDKLGNIALEKNIGKDILLPIDTFNLGAETDQYIEFSKPFHKVGYYMLLSNYFSNLDNNRMVAIGQTIYIRFPKIEGYPKNVAELKNWLAGKNVYFFYQFEQPQMINLGSLPDSLKTTSGANEITAQTNLGDVNLEVEYFQDINKVISNLKGLMITNQLQGEEVESC